MTPHNIEVLPNERWKQIQSWERYLISDHGRAYSLKFEKLIKLSIGSQTGYPMVDLQYPIKRKNSTVHRLVALHFIDNPNNLPFVNHKDGNKTNNHYTNLEWVTRRGNAKHASINGLIAHGEKHYNSVLTYDDVLFIRSLRFMYDVPVWKISRIYNEITRSAVESVLSFKTWSI